MAQFFVATLSLASDPGFYNAEQNVFDRYDNLSAVCDELGLANWSSLVSASVDHDAVPTAALFANFRNGQASKRLCQIAAARVAWGTPCYAQTWHHCVQHDDDPSLDVFPPQEPRCEWSLTPYYFAPFAYGCTSGRSPLHPPVTRHYGMNSSCDSAAACRTLLHAIIPAAAVGEAGGAIYEGFAPVDAVTTFNPKWDLHCRNGGVRHWSYTSDDDNHTLQMTEGNVDCVCPDGWEGVECAQCSSDASCSAAGYGASAKCDRTIGVADDAPMSSSCLPIGGTKLFFESITRTKSTFPNVHISRKHGTVRIAVLGETDYPWNSTALVPDPTLYGANSSGFLQNPTSFHMVGSGCSSERRGKCPIAGGHPPGSTCNNLVCPTIRYECPSDCDNDQHGGVTTHCTPTTSRFVNCPAERNLPAGQFSVSVTEMSTNLPPGDDLIVSFKLAALGPFQIACKIGGCRDGSGPTPPTSPPAPAPAPAPVPPAPGAAIDPCSAPALAAHPERAATCSTASYALIFFGPLVATLAVLFSVLLLGGGVKGIGAICTRRCLAPAHLGSGWQEKDADGSGGAAAAGTVPPAAAEEGASLATALLDVTEAPPTISPRRAVPPPTLPAVAERESAGEGGSANAESAAVTLEDEARDFSGASARGIAFRTVACSTGGLLSACKGERAILRGVSGVCRAGELLAVMGPSGCGKTTLLDILSGRKNTGTVSGEVRIDGDVLHSRARRQCTSMVFQDDVLPATSTAAEFLEFHAALRPTHAAVGGESGRTPPTRAEIVAARRARMRRYVAQMDLAKCINTPMGDELTRGLSGGEKRRVSIASALMSSPSVLFLDEPTSGLDSSSAQSVIGALDLVVNDGCAAVFVIHQPPAQLFEHFDRLLLLSGDGRALYSGPRRDVLRYFAQLDGQLAMGGALVCPTDASPPEFLMDLVMLSPPETIDALAREWPNSAIGRHTELLASAAAGTASGGPGGVQGAGGAFRSTSENAVAQCARTQCAPAALATVVPDFLRQVYRLTLRNAIVVVRRPTVLLVHYAATLALAAALAVAFPPFDLGDKKTLNAVLERIGFFFFVLSYFFLASLSVVGIWREERLLFLRERDARCYSAPAYLTSKFLCDTLLLRVVPPSLFAAITYAAVNLRVGPHFAFNFAQLLVATNVGATAIFFAVSVLAPSVSSANLLCILVSLFNMLFCGALAQKESFASSMKWIFRLAPMSYAYEGLMINEMVGLVYNLGYNLAGGAHLRLPPQDGVVLLLQQGLCANYIPETTSGLPASETCATDARSDVVGVWLTPLVAVAVSAILLIFFVKYRR